MPLLRGPPSRLRRAEPNWGRSRNRRRMDCGHGELPGGSTHAEVRDKPSRGRWSSPHCKTTGWLSRPGRRGLDRRSLTTDVADERRNNIEQLFRKASWRTLQFPGIESARLENGKNKFPNKIIKRFKIKIHYLDDKN